MFIHLVLFRIRKRDVRTYEADCRMWARQARKHKGFLGYHTLYRTNEPDQYASFYMWRSERDYRRFMGLHHDRLVSLSKCPVKVLGYYNFRT
jgi:heme-degrading monooxygenase HmoA